jgi:hypothetical protein
MGEKINTTEDRDQEMSDAEAADRIDYNSRGDLDDIAISDVTMFRMDRMDSGVFWLRCYRDGKPGVIFWLRSMRKITGEHRYENCHTSAENAGQRPTVKTALPPGAVPPNRPVAVASGSS